MPTKVFKTDLCKHGYTTVSNSMSLKNSQFLKLKIFSLIDKDNYIF